MESRVGLRRALAAVVLSCAGCAGAPLRGPAGGPETAWIRVSPNAARFFARESDPSPLVAFVSPDGRWSGTVPVAKPPRFDVASDGTTPVLHLSLAQGGEVECSIHEGRIWAANRIRLLDETLRSALDVIGAGIVGVHPVDGHPLVLFDLIYTAKQDGEVLPGEDKLAIWTHPQRSVLCTQDDVGYRDSFEALVRALAASLRDAKADPLPAPTFSSISVMRLGAQPVAYALVRQFANADGTTKEYRVQSMLLPTAQGLKSREQLAAETRSKTGELVAGDASIGREDDLTNVEYATTAGTPLTLSVKVSTGDKTTQHDLPAPLGLRSLSTEEELAIATGRAPAVEVGYFSPIAPDRVHPITVRKGAQPRTLEMVIQGLTTTEILDERGLVTSATVPLAPGVSLLYETLWSTGKPR